MSDQHHAQAAVRPAGSPKKLGARLRALIEAGPPQQRRAETSAETADRIAEGRRQAEEVGALRTRLAEAFAEARGWRAAPSPLAVRELAVRSGGGSWHRPPREWHGALLSPTFFRDAERRAAGMVAHVLAAQAEQDRVAIELWAAERELVATFPGFPSWVDPVGSVVVVLEPVPPTAAAAPAPAAIAAPIVPPEPAPVEAPAPPAVPAVPDTAEPPLEEIDHPAEPPAPDRPVPPRPPAIMRPIASVDLGDAVPRDLAGEDDPHFDVVDPRELLVDEAYQRDLSPKSLALIRRIVENWSWGKYKVPNCVRVDGRLHVVDGQHTAIAAASHPGIQSVLVLVSTLPEVADRAAAFLSHAQNRLGATHLQVHKAAVTAGDAEAVTLDDVCRRAGVDLLSFAASDGRYAPRQTVAVIGLRRLVAKRGPERSVEILAALAAADLAPITADHLRLGEALLCDPAYAEAFTPERLTEAMRGLTPKVQAEARELGIAQRLPAWRALAAVLYRNSAKPKPRGRGEPAAPRRRAGA